MSGPISTFLFKSDRIRHLGRFLVSNLLLASFIIEKLGAAWEMGIDVFVDSAFHFDTNSDSTSRVDVDPDAEWYVVNVHCKSSTVVYPLLLCFPLRGRIQRKTWFIWDLMPEMTITTLCPLQSRLQHSYHLPWATLSRVDRNPTPESTLSPSQRL
jgi:hypothetical protein